MRTLGRSSVLVVGVGGLGVEVAKNLILTGVATVSLHDAGVVTEFDLGSHCYAQEADVGKPRLSEHLVAALAELNTGCSVRVHEGGLSEADISGKYGAVVWCDPDPGTMQAFAAANAASRVRGVKHVLAQALGVVGRCFCDFGDQHVVNDADGRDPVRHALNGFDFETGEIQLSDDSAEIGLQTGDAVVCNGIELEDGSVLPPSEHTVTSILSGMRLAVAPPPISQGPKYLRGGHLLQRKLPRTVSFRSFEASLAEPVFMTDFVTDCDSLHLAFAAHHGHLREGQQLSVAAAEATKLLATFGKASLSPVVTVIGGFAAQEVMKALTGKYSPLQQWMYFDGRCAMPPSAAPDASGKGRLASAVLVFGSAAVKRMQDAKAFVVGCGALGCELLKGMALMGVATGAKGFVTVTDPDKIERSNLARQFLFRNHHVGEHKSRTATDAARAINSKLKIKPMTQKVCMDTEDTFNQRFWERQDVIVNALDNVAARRYVDSQCIRYRKPLLESGTLGPQAHTQVIVPKLTENYGQQADPDTGDIPACTLHFFPSTIEHTVAFARDWFSGVFEIPASNAAAFAADPSGWMSRCGAAPRDAVMQMLSALRQRPVSAKDSVVWARRTFEVTFRLSALQLLHWHPPDKRDQDGRLFWQGKLRPPIPIAFDPQCAEHRLFVLLSAKLRSASFGVDMPEEGAEFDAWLAEAEHQLPVFTADDSAPAPVPGQQRPPEAAAAAAEDGDAELSRAVAELESLSKDEAVRALRPAPIQFDKDGTGNGHVEIVTLCSNLRASMYSIPTIDRLETKRIAGRILPAMITTTALITGAVCLEMYKLFAVAETPIERFRNYWVNLAIPAILPSEPLRAVPQPYLESGDVQGHPLQGKVWTVWDRFEIPSRGGDAELGQLFAAVKEKYGLCVKQMSTQRGQLVYSERGFPELYTEMVLSQPVASLVSKLTGGALEKVIDFVVEAEVDGAVVGSLPPLRYKVV
eukprot:TRINITY_DN29891_c0_g1_i1.p1 TRINITY_DN29891_c0_g1~~TRINITY_DN29891_c0_g1_i1.p1  ORF type:complete len:978 (+),score=192.25 TRINITY_DN29891_c0_g1_i1:243-3176(+)